MSKIITYVPLSSVERIELRVTNCRKTLSQVKAETKAHYVLNGGMWNPDGSACPLLKVGGVMRSGTPWRAMGYAWDKGPDIHMTSEYGGADNFIAVTAIIASGKPVDKPSYGSAQGGKRGRSAIGLRGGSLALYCSGDGTGDVTTPEELRDELAGLGWASAVMLDGGGSSQCDFGGERITASRKVHNWICVYLKQGGTETPPEQEDKPMSKYTVTPSIGVNIRSGPGTSYGKAGAYPMGTVVDVLEVRDGWGRTTKGWVSLAYLEAVEGPQRVTDTGLAIQTHLIAPGADNRPGGSNPCKYITIHETGNAAKGADAAAHGAYLDSAAGEDRSGELALHRGRPRHCPAPARLRDSVPCRGRQGRAGQHHQHRHRDLASTPEAIFRRPRPTPPPWCACSWRSTGLALSMSSSTTTGTARTAQRPSGPPPGPGRRSWRSAGERRRMCPSWTPTWTRWLMSALSTSPTTGKPGTTPRILWRP